MSEAALAYAHLLAILSWVVFLSSTAALTRAEWMNPAVLQRLQVVIRIANIAGLLVLATGLARWGLGAKGAAWYAHQPLLWAKCALWGWMAVASWRVQRELAAWLAHWQATAELPAAPEIAALRQRVMRASHLMLVIPLAAVLLARGLLTL